MSWFSDGCTEYCSFLPLCSPGPSFAALSLVKNVANKFRSRITHFNSRTPFLGEEMPSFKLLDSDDDISDCDKENEVAEAITPACSQVFFLLSFCFEYFMKQFFLLYHCRIFSLFILLRTLLMI